MESMSRRTEAMIAVKGMEPNIKILVISDFHFKFGIYC